MCADAADWPSSLDRILALADGRPLVAHNASFDIGVIRDACDLCQLSWPELHYACTLVMARRLWPQLGSHRLPFVAHHLGLAVADRHDAAIDAALAAEIGLRALTVAAESSWFTLAEALRIHLGLVSADAWSGCRSKDLVSAPPTEPSANADIDPGHPLYGNAVAFTGAVAVPRREAQQAVVDVGGIAERGVTRNTSYLVAGFQDLSKLATGETKSNKLRKAEALRAAGQQIEIITESEFVALLGAADPDEVGGTRPAPEPPV